MSLSSTPHADGWTVVVKESAGERVVARRAAMAITLVRRLVGLLTRASMEADEALILPRCNAIHTWFMRITIDVVFLKEGRVVKTAPALRPFRCAWAPSADTVIEFAQGSIARAGMTVGSLLAWEVS